MSKIIPARFAETSADYKKYGIQKDSVEQWEDGLRTEGKKGEFEWWYFDAKLEDSSSLVITFFTNPYVSVKDGFEPYLSLHLTRPDGTELEEEFKVDPKKCSFSKEHCHAVIGDSVFEGDLHTYHILYKSAKISIDVTLTGNVPAWRHGTGYIVYGDNDYFAWIPCVPEGDVHAEITVNGKTEKLSGTGYHDHNWGNTAMFKLMHHWYWGRAKVGEYQVISSYITAQKKFGYEHFPIFMIAKDGKILGDENKYLSYKQRDAAFDEVTGKHYYKSLIYDYDDGEQHYIVTYKVKEHLEKKDLTAGADGKPASGFKKLGMKMAGLAPTYNRLGGTVTVEKIENGKVIESVSAPSIWELMYFGMDADV